MAVDPMGMKRPQRWDVPFGPAMTDADVDRLLAIPPFNRIDPERFPATVPLPGLFLNDARIVRYQNGDIVVRRGDYGNSAFFILSGTVRVELDLIDNPLPMSLLGRQRTKRKSLVRALAQLWSNHRQPEFRDPSRYRYDPSIAQRGSQNEVRIFLQDLPAVLDQHRTAALHAGQLFGELAALGRTPRTATVFAEGSAELLEIRWQGLRDLMRRDEALKAHIDELFRERALLTFLRSMPLFAHLSAEQAQVVADNTQFESYGRYDEAGTFHELANPDGRPSLEHEPIIVEEGHYPNGLIMIRSGLARLSRRVNHGERTVNYLVPGQAYGLDELSKNWQGPEHVPLPYTLRAVGYVNAVIVPTPIIEEFVFRQAPYARATLPVSASTARAPAASTAQMDTDTLEFLVERHFINGTATMVIDLDRCTRCDDCVRACAATHDNNPRFLRQGPTHGHYMVANACMHCLDPVCMIECPTGAIHRDPGRGAVVINDRTCIGCTACARNCPYDAIRMVEIRDEDGNFFLDQNNQPINKATKCNLCIDQRGGPACQRACPHDALKRVDMRDSKGLADWLNR
jgi:Fe-S-cluster-containing dehydrogenase component/CRP-like cAMP-binding protein